MTDFIHILLVDKFAISHFIRCTCCAILSIDFKRWPPMKYVMTKMEEVRNDHDVVRGFMKRPD